MESDLFSALAAYGADMAGIRDRFMGDEALYALCLHEFFDEPNFPPLHAAIEAADWEAAFRSAHAIKGLAGNMGLTPFYEAICVLVESLRTGQCDTAVAEYEAVMAAQRAVAEAVADALENRQGEVDAFEC